MTVTEKIIGMSRYLEVGAEGQGIREYEINMLKYNDFSYLLKPDILMDDDKNCFLYRADGLTGKWDVRKIRSLMEDITAALAEAERYLLDTESVCLDFDNIMYDEDAGRFRFMYIPGINKDFRESLMRLLERMIEESDRGADSDILCVYDLYAEVSEKGFNPAALQGFLNMHKGMGYGAERSMTVNVTDVTEAPAGMYAGAAAACGSTGGYTSAAGTYAGYGTAAETGLDTGIYGTEVGTVGGTDVYYAAGTESSVEKTGRQFVFPIFAAAFLVGGVLLLIFMSGFEAKLAAGVLCAGGMTLFIMLYGREEDDAPDEAMREYMRNAGVAQNAPAYIPQSRDNTESQAAVTRLVPVLPGGQGIISIKGGSVLVGRIKNNADYCIDAEGISRIHANIIKNRGRVTITDMNSTNGTYVNGQRIYNGTPVELKRGDRVSFANQEYYCL